MPIELVWNDLKYFLCTEVQPQNEMDLINGVKKFWQDKVDFEYCNKKIDHLNKVLTKILFSFKFKLAERNFFERD